MQSLRLNIMSGEEDEEGDPARTCHVFQVGSTDLNSTGCSVCYWSQSSVGKSAIHQQLFGCKAILKAVGLVEAPGVPIRRAAPISVLQTKARPSAYRLASHPIPTVINAEA